MSFLKKKDEEKLDKKLQTATWVDHLEDNIDNVYDQIILIQEKVNCLVEFNSIQVDKKKPMFYSVKPYHYHILNFKKKVGDLIQTLNQYEKQKNLKKSILYWPKMKKKHDSQKNFQNIMKCLITPLKISIEAAEEAKIRTQDETEIRTHDETVEEISLLYSSTQWQHPSLVYPSGWEERRDNFNKKYFLMILEY